MRCPKCGYNSFDYLDSCKKCGKDLVEFKQKYGIRSILFPGLMKPGEVVAEAEFDHDVAAAAVTAATATAVEPAVEEFTAPATDSDDFGFDFMSDSAEDDDLSFDELFEEAPEEEDVEETIEAPKEEDVEETIETPKEKPAAQTEDESVDDVSFDLFDEDTGLDDDFGFDSGESQENDESDLKNETEKAGTEEDPQSPFDLPESPQFVKTPDEKLNISAELFSASVVGGKTDHVFAEDIDSSAQKSGSENDVIDPDEKTSFSQKPVEQTEPADFVVSTKNSQTAVTQSIDKVEEIDTVFSPAAAAMPIVTENPPEDVSINNVTETFPSLKGRVGAFVCDFVLLVIVGAGFIVAAEAAMSTENTWLLPSLETLIDLSVPYFLVLFFLIFGYFTLFHFLTGQTPGEMLTGLRVETMEGEPLVFAQAFLRSVGGLLQFLPVGLGYLVILASPERRGWNDRLAGTRVVALPDLSEKI